MRNGARRECSALTILLPPQTMREDKNTSGGAGIIGSTEHHHHIMSLCDQREDRYRFGSSHGTLRVNAEAKRICVEARVLKKAKKSQEAYELYTRAIQFDPFNHTYFHHRAETALIAKQYEDGMRNTQFGLDLCLPFENFKNDEFSSLMRCTLTRCCMEMNQYKKAKQCCEMGLKAISVEDAQDVSFALKVLAKYHCIILEAIKQLPTDVALVQFKQVRNVGDKLGFW